MENFVSLEKLFKKFGVGEDFVNPNRNIKNLVLEKMLLCGIGTKFDVGDNFLRRKSSTKNIVQEKNF